MHGGIGVGMLDAACAGEVFASPTPDQMLAATTTVDTGAGVLHIVKNYTGDVMNFEMAAEMAADAGVEVATVVVADDVAVQDSLYTAGAAASARPSSWRRSWEPQPRRAPTWRPSPRLRRRSRTTAARWAWP